MVLYLLRPKLLIFLRIDKNFAVHIVHCVHVCGQWTGNAVAWRKSSAWFTTKMPIDLPQKFRLCLVVREKKCIFLACRGGWPASLYARTSKAKLLTATEYVNTLCTDDISRQDRVKIIPLGCLKW